ncbi:MAG: hypothetical protein R3A45_02085 [Bdellovibrionota bacterium]
MGFHKKYIYLAQVSLLTLVSFSQLAFGPNKTYYGAKRTFADGRTIEVWLAMVFTPTLERYIEMCQNIAEDETLDMLATRRVPTEDLTKLEGESNHFCQHPIFASNGPTGEPDPNIEAGNICCLNGTMHTTIKDFDHPEFRKKSSQLKRPQTNAPTSA